MEKSGKYWNWFVVARECLTVFILVIGKDLKLFQVLFLLVSSGLSQALWIQLMPYKERSVNLWGLSNEIVVSVYLYLIIVVTYLNMQEEPDIDLREKIGWFLLVLVFTTLLVNLIKAIVSDIRSFT